MFPAGGGRRRRRVGRRGLRRVIILFCCELASKRGGGWRVGGVDGYEYYDMQPKQAVCGDLNRILALPRRKRMAIMGSKRTDRTRSLKSSNFVRLERDYLLFLLLGDGAFVGNWYGF